MTYDTFAVYTHQTVVAHILFLHNPEEACVSKWQEQWEATQSNRNTTFTQKNNSRVVTPCRGGVHGGRPTECAQDRLPPRQRNICGATERGKPVISAKIMTNCRLFGERPNRDDIAKMEGRAVRWMSAVADTI